MRKLDVTKLSLPVVDLWMNQWLLLTAGTVKDHNMMTVAWGSIGCMWARPFAQVVVRPQRHTRKYMDGLDSFTLCAFPEKYRKDLQTLGTLSGRDCDKLAATRLTLKPSKTVSAPILQRSKFHPGMPDYLLPGHESGRIRGQGNSKKLPGKRLSQDLFRRNPCRIL